MSLEQEFKKIKRQSNSRGYFNREGEFFPTDFFVLSPYLEHVPMKNESKKLRNIMSKTSLNRDEVVKIKKYRKELSIAQSNQGPLTSFNRKFIKNCKQFMKETSTTIFDPQFNNKFNKYMSEIALNSFWSRNFLGSPYMPNDSASTYLRLIKLRKNRTNS